MNARNLHGTAVVLGDRGVLITGPSGSGKTTLALALVEACRVLGHFARLVSDDQVWVTESRGSLLVSTRRPLPGWSNCMGCTRCGSRRNRVR